MARKVKKKARKLTANKPVHLAAPNFTPPPYRWAFGALFGVEFLLIIWALMHHFIPSNHWQTLAFYLNIVICSICTVYFLLALWRNKHLYPSLLQTAFLILFAPVFIYFWGYLALTYGAGNVITHLTGKPAVIEDVLSKHPDDDARFQKEYVAKGVYEKRYFDNRKGCITRLTGPALKNALPVYVCVNGQEFAKLPKQVAVNIHGIQTYTGFDIEHVEYDWLKTSFLSTKDEVRSKHAM